MRSPWIELVEDQGVILALCFTAKQHHQLVISHLWPSALSHRHPTVPRELQWSLLWGTDLQKL